MESVSFDVKQYKRKGKLIIYGASAYGEIGCYILTKAGIKIDFFCDQKATTAINGIPVIKPEEISIYQGDVFIVASADSFWEIKNYLEESGCKYVYDMCLLLESNFDTQYLSNRARDIYDNRQNYLDVVKQIRKGGIYFSRIQYVVSERCSLRCRDCSHLMQYYRNPQDVNIEEYKYAFNRFLDVVEQISELRIMGGEPFMNKELYKLIETYYGHPKIKHISIYTNGTIVPSTRNMEAMRSKRIRIHISDYGVNEAGINNTIWALGEEGLEYFVRKYDSWQDSGGLQKRCYSDEEKKKMFSACFERNSYSFYRGKLYRCARSAHGMNMGAIPWKESDVVDFTGNAFSEDFARKGICELQHKEYLRACDYCGGPNYHEGHIPAGIQAKQPLNF